jgi:hypothetical protein
VPRAGAPVPRAAGAAAARGRGAYVLLKLLRELVTVNVPSGCTDTLM